MIPPPPVRRARRADRVQLGRGVAISLGEEVSVVIGEGDRSDDRPFRDLRRIDTCRGEKCNHGDQLLARAPRVSPLPHRSLSSRTPHRLWGRARSWSLQDRFGHGVERRPA